jgi:hypothetical protein
MAYQAVVIPVMIASPGDVSEERRIVREVIHEWNDINAATSRIILAPVGWETHSSPELGERPQELINSKVLKQCDLLVGVFWTRLGTPTREARSGTVEEIERHVSEGKPAMLYFSSRPVAPESVDRDQYEAVKNFRESCRQRGLIESFDDPQQFRAMFSKHLQITVYQNEFLVGLAANGGGAPLSIELEEAPKLDNIQVTADQAALLSAAVKGKGNIIKRIVIGSRVILAGGQSFGADSGREYARWEAALEELIVEGLVVERGYQGQMYELTHRGWTVAEGL